MSEVDDQTNVPLSESRPHDLVTQVPVTPANESPSPIEDHINRQSSVTPPPAPRGRTPGGHSLSPSPGREKTSRRSNERNSPSRDILPVRNNQTAPQGFHKITHHHRRFSRRSDPKYSPWETKSRDPFHAYVHGLVEAGWWNLRGLDDYLETDYADQNLHVSIVDFTNDYRLRRQPDVFDEAGLKRALDAGRPEDVRVRLYLAEQLGPLASGVIESLGSSLKLDPRFFQWNIYGNDRNLLSPSERHRSKFISIGFTVPDSSTPQTTDSEFFRVSIYIQPDAKGPGWTGVILFNSHSKVEDISVYEFVSPPPFPNVPKIPPRTPMTFRELYLASLEFINIQEAAQSPFYCTHFLWRMNCFCWSMIIQAIRDEDEKLQGISESSVYHIEEIRKSYTLVQRGGSFGWSTSNGPHECENRQRLEEDFKHLLEQASLLWSTREKRFAIKKRNHDGRAATLTNAFTFIFVPISLVSSVYGMNVSQITGSGQNPNIWQFFVVVIGINIVIMTSLMITHFVNQIARFGRTAGFKEILGFAVGRGSRF